MISCVIDQSVRNLATRVPQSRLDRHDQTVAALSVPLDHSTSIDVAVMRGRVDDVSSYAEALFLERGIMHGVGEPHPGATGHHRPCPQPGPAARAHPHQGAEQFLTVDSWSGSKMPTTIGS